MKSKTITFGFCTKDLSTLNADLMKYNEGRLPTKEGIKKIEISVYDLTDHSQHLHVYVELYNLPL